MIRTQQEILDRVNTVDDFLGTQKSDLIAYLDFEHAKEFLNEEFLAKVEAGEEKWEANTDPKKEIIEYIPFAFGKAYDQRGISAGRSLMHMASWIWLDDEDFYNEIKDDLEDYDNYGLPELIRICKHYGIEIPADE